MVHFKLSREVVCHLDSSLFVENANMNIAIEIGDLISFIADVRYLERVLLIYREHRIWELLGELMQSILLRKSMSFQIIRW